MPHTHTSKTTIHSTLAGDPQLAGMVAEFVADMPGRMARFRRQLESQDWNALRRSAHQLKGAAGSYGFEALTPLAQRVESALLDKVDPQQVLSAVQELSAQCQRITAAAPRN